MVECFRVFRVKVNSSRIVDECVVPVLERLVALAAHEAGARVQRLSLQQIREIVNRLLPVPVSKNIAA